MRVGILSYPMLFQRESVLQVQVRETIAALNRLGQTDAHPLQAQLLDPNRDRLDAFDMIHVFSAAHGNHRVVEAATEMGVPVVLSPLLSPGWDGAAGFRSRVADRLAGRLTAWHVQTNYVQTKKALQLARLVIALGEPERDTLTAGFLIDPAKIRVFPGGISRHFFHARPELFRHRTGVRGPFVLMTGAISPYKNQLGLIQALEGLDLPVVLIGRCGRDDQGYLEAVLRSPRVRWLGDLPQHDPLLAAAFGAASVVALPSHGEVFPLAVLEALASGTPVVMTDENALDLRESSFALRKVAWHDACAQRDAIRQFVEQPPEREVVRALVEEYTWQRIASQIANCYADLETRLAAERTGVPQLAHIRASVPAERGVIAHAEREQGAV
jgi:glycosyltransferase involved in cell wall biosynthesis